MREGDYSEDFDYAGKEALHWSSPQSATWNFPQTIAGKAFNCALPDRGAEGSLSYRSDIVVDGIRPYAMNVTATNNTYYLGQEVLINVNFNENVTVGTSAAETKLELDFGGGAKNATLDTDRSTPTRLVFSYMVDTGDAASRLDYTAASALSGNITDAAGNMMNNTVALPAPNADGSLGRTSEIETIPEVLFAITQVSSPGGAAAYGIDDAIVVNVTFSEPVTVTDSGTPYLSLTIGGAARNATYVQGSGPASSLLFSYTVAEGDGSPPGPGSVAVTALTLNGSTITNGDGDAAPLDLPTEPSATLPAITADGTYPTAETVASPDAGRLYTWNQAIRLDVTFDEDMMVDTSSGTPRLALDINTTHGDDHPCGHPDNRPVGYPAPGTVRNATYMQGSGSDTLRFSYDVGPCDQWDVLNYSGTSALDLNGGVISDLAGNAWGAAAALPVPRADGIRTADGAAIQVDGVSPVVSRISSPDAGLQGIGDTIRIDVAFTDPLVVDTSGGDPTLALSTGAVAAYSGNGSSSLLFSYTVRENDGSSGDLGVAGPSALSFNGATIVDALGHDASTDLTHLPADQSLAGTSDVSVDAVRPTVVNVSLRNAPADGAAYVLNDTIRVGVNFSEAVQVDAAQGTPYLALATGGTGGARALYESGTGTASLLFSYTVQPDDTASALDYANMTALSDGGGSISDVAGNAADLDLVAPGAAGSLAAANPAAVNGSAAAGNRTGDGPPGDMPSPSGPGPAQMCSMSIARDPIDFTQVKLDAASGDEMQTVTNAGTLEFAGVSLEAGPWYTGAGAACDAPSGAPFLPVGLTEVRQTTGGAYADLTRSGTSVDSAEGLDAGGSATLWFRLNPVGHDNLSPAQITQCITYVAECRVP